MIQPAEPPPVRLSSPGPLPRPHPRSTVDVDVDMNLYVGLVRPGDKLVVAIGRQLDMATADRIRELLEAKLPDVEVVPVEAAALVVYRP